MTLKVGITGGIGSGKSTVCKVFQALGIPVYHADDIARIITDEHPGVIMRIKEVFGDEMYLNGKLNRAKMASVVFNNPAELAKLNNIIHPAVREEFRLWYERNQHAPYVIQEAAIMFESGVYKQIDKVVLIACPQETRIERAIQRGATREEVLNRIQNQMPEEEKLEKANHVIWNDGTTPVIEQVMALDKLFRHVMV